MAASVCLYSVYRKQERSLFTAALEQTSSVPTTIIRPRPTAGLWSPIPSILSAIASPPSRCTSAFWQVRHGAGDPAAARGFTRPSLPRPTGGDAVIPRPIVRGPMVVVLPRSRSPVLPPGRFGRATTDYVDRPQAALGSRHRLGTAPGPAGDRPSPLRAPTGDPTPITRVKVRTRAKSTTGFSLSKPVPGFKSANRFSGCRLTSLFNRALPCDAREYLYYLWSRLHLACGWSCTDDWLLEKESLSTFWAVLCFVFTFVHVLLHKTSA